MAVYSDVQKFFTTFSFVVQYTFCPKDKTIAKREIFSHKQHSEIRYFPLFINHNIYRLNFVMRVLLLGKFRSVGGIVTGDSGNAGAAGTVYKYESRRGPQYRELKYNPEANLTSFKPEHAKVKVDNENNDVATPTVIMENQTVFYEFDEMQVEGRAC